MDAHDRMFGEIAVRLELLTREQLASCRRVQAEGGPPRNLGQLALALGLMSEAEVELVFTHQKRVLSRRREARESTKRTETSAAITSAQRPSRATRGQSASGAPGASGHGHAPPAANRGKRSGEDEREPTIPRVPSEPRSLIGIGLAVPDLPPQALANDMSRTPAASAGLVSSGAAANALGLAATMVSVSSASFGAGGTGSARNLASAVSSDTGTLRSLAPGPGSARVHAASLQAMSAASPSIAPAPRSKPATPPPIPPARTARSSAPPAAQGTGRSSAPAPQASTSSDSGARLNPATGSGAGVPRSPAPPPPHARGGSERPNRRTEIPPFRARRMASPPPANTNGRTGARPVEALLAGRGHLEHVSRNEALRSLAPAAGALRPAIDRGWRNPSKPPPPMAAKHAEPTPASLLQAAPATGRISADIAAEVGDARPRFDKYLDQLLQIAAETGASDLHAHSGAPVLARVDGTLHALTGDAPLSPEAAEAVIAELLDDRQWDTLQALGEVRFGYELPGIGRFRGQAYRQERGVDVVFRVLTPAASPAELELPPALLETLLAAAPGLFLVSGSPGCGKSTTLAALTHALANEHHRYVVTAEAPIEIAHRPGLGMIEQREIPFDAHTFAECIDQSLRQGADVLVISELSTPSSVAAAVQAAQSGCTVLAAVQAESPWRALAQLASHFPGLERPAWRAQLANALRAVFGQRLVARASGRGRRPVLEILRQNTDVAQLIAADEFDVLERVMIAEKNNGMQTLEDALNALVRAEAITPEAAKRVARRPDQIASGTGSA